MNLKRSVDNVAKRLVRFDLVAGSNNKTGLSVWKGRPIIPLDEWIGIRNTANALDYFPDDFDLVLTCLLEDQMCGARTCKEMGVRLLIINGICEEPYIW